MDVLGENTETLAWHREGVVAALTAHTSDMIHTLSTEDAEKRWTWVKGLLAVEQDLLPSLKTGNRHAFPSRWHIDMVIAVLGRYINSLECRLAHAENRNAGTQRDLAIKLDALRRILFNEKVLAARLHSALGAELPRSLEAFATAPLHRKPTPATAPSSIKAPNATANKIEKHPSRLSGLVYPIKRARGSLSQPVVFNGAPEQMSSAQEVKEAERKRRRELGEMENGVSLVA
jgi:hypothetical protein